MDDKICSVEGCENKHRTKSFCQKHYMRYWTHGSPHIVKQKAPNVKKKIRFYEDLNGCFIVYSHKKNRQGYPSIRINNHTYSVHRFVYMELFGGLTSDEHVRHKCDVPACINPEHLTVGSHSDNMRDMVERLGSARGERNGCAKLSEKEVLEIRELTKEHSSFAVSKMYNVSYVTINRIKNKESWKHI